MKYLLNSKVKILAFERVEEEGGAFIERCISVGDFFCQTDLKKEGMEQVLTLIARGHSMLKSQILKVVFEGATYDCVNSKVIEDGFFKLVCKK